MKNVEEFFGRLSVASDSTPDETTEFAFLQALWSAAFKSADVAFKLVSWGLILGLFKLLAPTQNLWFKMIFVVLNLMFGAVLLLACLMLFVRHPRDFGFRGAPVYIVKFIMIALCVFAIMFAVSPSLELDRVIDALVGGRAQNHPTEPALKTGPSR